MDKAVDNPAVKVDTNGSDINNKFREEVVPQLTNEAKIREDIKEFTTKNFEKLDRDGNGYLAFQELTQALYVPSFSRNETTLRHMIKRYEGLRSASNDEWGAESVISKKDPEKYVEQLKSRKMYNLEGEAAIRQGIQELALKDFDLIDLNGDGLLERDELNTRLMCPDLKEPDRNVIEQMVNAKRYQNICFVSNDETGLESIVTRKDLLEL